MMVPPMQPTLADERVTLRPMQAEDREPLFAVASDPEIWALHPAHDRWQRAVFDPFFDECLMSNGGLTIIDSADDRIVGASRYDIRVCEPGEVEIGWTFLERAAWGGTVNRAIKRLMIGYALERFERVIFLVGEGNLRSQRALEKIGAILTERWQAWPMAGGVDVDHLIYAIDRAGFATGPLVTP